ncbi:PAS domain S-box protein [Paenibacillus silviterrae]|uniref:PAS domain S-box protein n=1 Tax=Paenibacillus silviterrae TaxID=3242194 RepID=UPI002542A8B7|nr:PAS domain S-box protein [Paenibacillus chinjuensis]
MANLRMDKDAFFVHAFEKAPIGMAFVSLNGYFLKANEALRHMFGYSNDELLAMRYQDITEKQDLESSMEQVRKLLEGEADHFQLEKRYVHPSGRLLWGLTSASLVRDEVGTALYFIVQLQDVTTRKCTEKQLQVSKQRYKSLVEQHPDLVMSIALDGTLLRVNDACERVTGYSKHEMPEAFDNMLLKDHELFRKHYEEALLGTSQEFEGRITHKSGREVLLRVTYVPIIIEDRIVGIYAISKDVTEFKRTTEQLRHHQELYELISGHAQEIIMYAKPDGHIEYISPAVQAKLGFTPEELKGWHLADLWHPEDAPLLRSDGLFHASDEDVITSRMRHRNGQELWFETTFKAIRNGQGDIEKVLGISRDISDRKAAEEEAKRAQQIMLNTEKLSLAGQLAAGIAHEIRNPLTAIKGFLQLLERQIAQKPQYFEIISEEMNRIELILNELLLLAKPREADFLSKDVRHVIAQVIQLLESQALMKNVQLTAIMQEAELSVHCDENQLKQVFINFIKNAIESMSNGGVISIEAYTDPNGRMAVISIQDQGCGIPSDQLARLGEPFYTTKEKGSGLGFMVSKRIIEDHQGQLRVSSQVNQGTLVQVVLPLVP